MTTRKIAPIVSARKAITKRVRFEVLKRDGFKCVYCGADSSKSELEIDHIDPVSDGGGNEIWNLATSCFSCNRGKSDRKLSDTHPSFDQQTESVRASERSIQALKDAIAAKEDRIDADVWEVVERLYGEDETTKYRYDSIRNFFDRLDVAEIMEAADIARRKINGRVNRFSYFCGICCRKIERASS